MECGGKRSATPLWFVFVSISKRASQAKAASRFACRRTPYGSVCSCRQYILATAGLNGFVHRRSFDTHEAGAPDTPFSNEFLLGRRVLIIQGHRAADRWYRDPPFRSGCNLSAVDVAVASWADAAWARPLDDMPYGTNPLCRWTAVAGIWQSTRHGRQFGRADCVGAAGDFFGCRHFSPGAYRPTTAGRLRSGNVWRGIAQWHRTARFPLDQTGSEPDFRVVVCLRSSLFGTR